MAALLVRWIRVGCRRIIFCSKKSKTLGDGRWLWNYLVCGFLPCLLCSYATLLLDMSYATDATLCGAVISVSSIARNRQW